MAKITGDKRFIEVIRKYPEEVRKDIYAIARFYSAEVIKEVNRIQPPRANSPGASWINRTGAAAVGMFTGAYNRKDVIGFFLAHSVDYGIYLELANDRKNELIMPTLKKYLPLFMVDVKAVIKGRIT